MRDANRRLCVTPRKSKPTTSRITPPQLAVVCWRFGRALDSSGGQNGPILKVSGSEEPAADTGGQAGGKCAFDSASLLSEAQSRQSGQGLHTHPHKKGTNTSALAIE
jgi:hypothetical protein